VNELHTQALFERYPRLYQGRSLGIEKNLMSRGFCCGDGWLELIDRLSARIEAECRRLRDDEGWLEPDLPMATQVKEKFGTLRFRMTLSRITPKIKALIEEARGESEMICEVCGRQKVGIVALRDANSPDAD
jgi:hypothetical protein